MKHIDEQTSKIKGKPYWCLTGITQYVTQNLVFYFPGVSFTVSPCMRFF